MKDEKMVSVSIKGPLFKTISKIAMKEGTSEETIINDILNEVIEEYEDCELLEKVKQAEAEFEAGHTITLTPDELRERLGLNNGKKV